MVDRRDEQADERDRIADARDVAADERDRREDALDRAYDARDQRVLAARFQEAIKRLDRHAVDDSLSRVDWHAQVVVCASNDTAVQQELRLVSLVATMDNIREARHKLQRATGQAGPVAEVLRRHHELCQAREAYVRFTNH